MYKIKTLLNSVVEYIKNKLKITSEEFEWKCGWLKDEPDIRDFLFGSIDNQKTYLPVDLRPNCPPVLNQKTLASCTAFGAIGLVQFARKKQKFKKLWQPSPLFTYYATRVLQGTPTQDSGASVRNALKSVAKDGVVEERLYPYIIEKFATKPSDSLYKKAIDFQALSYRRLNDGSLTEMQECLDQGYPFIFGMLIFESFIKCPSNGIVPMPNIKKERSYGGHCLMCVGWKMINNSIYFILQNSWSTAWGENGYCYVPAEYITNPKLACDFWMIQIMEN
jgi:C1A family cysteine protease